MPFTERVYTDWVDWSDPLPVVYGGGDNIPSVPDFVSAGTAFVQVANDRGAVRFQQSPGGDDPNDDITCGFHGAQIGKTAGTGTEPVMFWPDFCPDPNDYGIFDPTDGISVGSAPNLTGYSITGIPGGAGPGSTTAIADIGGYAIYPWRFLDGAEVMDFLVGDARLAYATAHLPPGDGWSPLQTEWEVPYSTLVSIEIAPDEAVVGGSAYDGDVWWFDSSSASMPGWHFSRNFLGDFSFNGPGLVPVGDILYGGGSAAWGSVGWLPDQDLVTGEFVVPDNEDLNAVLYTLAHDGIVSGGSTGSHYRDHQTLAFRFMFKPPRLRFYKDETVSITPPRRGISRSDATRPLRGIGGRNSLQWGQRGIGSVI